MTYDIFGDIHGHHGTLVRLLEELGYRRAGGVWRHGETDRKAIFLGDFIDRGPKIRETLHLVREMVESGSAFAVMGNHEYNALCYDKEDADGNHLREHSEKNQKLHKETIDQFAGRKSEWKEFLSWFINLPLFLDLDGLRVVHASWESDMAGAVAEMSGGRNRIDDAFLRRSAVKGSTEHRMIERLLKGPELALPEGFTYGDKDGDPRRDIRVKWWEDLAGRTYHEALFPPADLALPESLIPEEAAAELRGYDEQIPVFFGHYWLPKDKPVVQRRDIACLDCSVARDGALAAYTWHGENDLDETNCRRIDVLPGQNGGGR